MSTNVNRLDAEECVIVNIALTDARVTRGFRQALFDASNRAGVGVSEFILMATGKVLANSGKSFPGIFRKGDFHPSNEAP